MAPFLNDAQNTRLKSIFRIIFMYFFSEKINFNLSILHFHAFKIILVKKNPKKSRNVDTERYHKNLRLNVTVYRRICLSI